MPVYEVAKLKAVPETVVTGNWSVYLVDIGAATTELAVFFEVDCAHTAVPPIGGDHFTGDLTGWGCM